MLNNEQTVVMTICSYMSSVCRIIQSCVLLSSYCARVGYIAFTSTSGMVERVIMYELDS